MDLSQMAINVVICVVERDNVLSCLLVFPMRDEQVGGSAFSVSRRRTYRLKDLLREER